VRARAGRHALLGGIGFPNVDDVRLVASWPSCGSEIVLHVIACAGHGPSEVAMARRRVSTVATLGDSVPVGLGDPRPDGGWRGVANLIKDALDAEWLVNPARTGARAECVRREQLPVALAARPQVAVVFVGMNDAMRADFDPRRLSHDYTAIVERLHAVGAHVVLLRYHDHSRIFWLPAPLRSALRSRVAALNAVVDAAARIGPDLTTVVDLHTVAGCYDRAAWAVDRLHPCERGHRLLAAAVVAAAGDAGFAVSRPVPLDDVDGHVVTAPERAWWLVVKGVPWLARRARDLAPLMLQGLIDELSRRFGAG
jgi:lysophospholipase L1-like esterase